MLTNLDKVFWEEEGYTKGDVIAYYDAMSKFILPYLKDRPMVLNRHPNGIAGKSFFQKNVDTTQIPSWIQTASVKHKGKTVEYILVQDKKTLLYVANLGCIELNPFHSRVGHLDNPDYLLIDLDPEDVPFDKVIEAALVIHHIFDDLKVANYCKTSGGRGLHIYVPLGAQYDFDQVQVMAKLIALLALEKLPDLISLERSPSKRQKQIYIDVPRNASGQTIAATYSLRPRPHAPVSTPLDWKEVKPGLDLLGFNIETVPKRVAHVGDLFKPVLMKGVNWKQALKRLQERIP
jgi:bifunctional non-homologous end joining protein LigD